MGASILTGNDEGEANPRKSGAGGSANLVKVEGSLGRKLDDHMTKRAGAGFGGVLLVAEDGEVVVAKGYYGPSTTLDDPTVNPLYGNHDQ